MACKIVLHFFPISKPHRTSSLLPGCAQYVHQANAHIQNACLPHMTKTAKHILRIQKSLTCRMRSEYSCGRSISELTPSGTMTRGEISDRRALRPGWRHHLTAKEQGTRVIQTSGYPRLKFQSVEYSADGTQTLGSETRLW